jgi:predicted transcriptional regulator
MQSKGVLKITNEEVRYARTYDAVVSKEEYIAWCVGDVVPGKNPKEQILSVVSALLNRKGVNKEVVDELKELIDEKEKEL